MKTLYLTDAGDLQFDGQNNLRMVEGIEEQQQSLRLLLATNRGEWFLNPTHGLEYAEITGKDVTELRARAALLEAFRQEPRIERLLSFQFAFDRHARQAVIDFSVLMDGQVVTGREVF